MNLAGAPMLITGATGGIGSPLAARLSSKGARLMLHGRDGVALQDLGSSLGAATAQADLMVPGAAGDLIEQTVSSLSGLEVLISNAGAGEASCLAEMSEAAIADIIDLNLGAPLRLAKAAIPHLRRSAAAGGRPCVVFVASIAGHLGVRLEAPYSAAKAGLIAAAEAIAEEERRFGVRVALVSPGAVDTAFFERRGMHYERRIPRLISPEQVVDDVIRVLTGPRVEVISPRWLRLAAVLKAASPTLYRTIASRMP